MKKILLISRARTAATIERAELFAERVRGSLASDIEIETCEMSELFFELSREKVAIYHPVKKFDLRDFDLVVMRQIGKMAIEAHAIARYCDNFGIKYTDEYLDRLLLDNKISTQFTLWFDGVKNWPHTFYGDLQEMKRRFAEFGGLAILKDNQGSRGRLNFLVKSTDEIQHIHDENPDVQFVLQEFIPNSGDWRVLVLNGKVSMVIERKSGSDSHLNNTSQGGAANILPLKDIPEAVKDIAVRAAKFTKLQVAGVDVMFDSRNGDIYLLEINNAPQISTGSFVEEKAVKYAEMLNEMVKNV